MDGKEGILVASKIADRVGITRSVIVNALRKFESAGVIESRSYGSGPVPGDRWDISGGTRASRTLPADTSGHCLPYPDSTPSPYAGRNLPRH